MEIDSENLIYLVFEKKALWDKTTKLYRNRLVVEKLWQQVAAELGGAVSSDGVKKKWKSLRDTFGKELRKVPEGRSGDEGPLNFETYTSWPHFEAMLFLKNQMRPRKSGGNLSVGGGLNGDDGGGNDIQIEHQEDVEQDSVAGSVLERIEANYADRYNTSRTDSCAEILPPSNKPIKRSAQLQLIDIEARKLKLLETKANRQSSTDDDEDVAFFKSLLPHVRKLKPEEKLEFRMDVQGLVQKYVYKKKKLMETQNTPHVPHTPVNPIMYDFQRNTPYSSNEPLAGIAPLPSYQSTPTIRTQAEINYNNNLTVVENEYPTVICTQRQYYSVISSPISSVASQK